jgi:hypothetical protein
MQGLGFSFNGGKIGWKRDSLSRQRKIKEGLLIPANKRGTPGGLTGNDLSRLFFTCTNTSQAATCTYNI